MHQRQQCLHLAAATVFTLLCAAPAAAQNYPAKVVRYLVNDGAGSGGDHGTAGKYIQKTGHGLGFSEGTNRDLIRECAAERSGASAA